MNFEDLKAEFDRRIRKLRPDNKTASKEEALRKCAEVLGEIVAENSLDIADIEGTTRQLLEEYYEKANKIMARFQREKDEKNNLKIKPQKAAFPAERVQKIAHSLVDPTVPQETIERRARNGVSNVAQSFQDDFVKENAKFRSKAGLKCYILRKTDGKCCDWCSGLAGRYVYGGEPEEVYHRHDNCTCSVTFENGRERQNVWTKEKWTVSPILKIPYKPTTFTHEEAQKIQQEKLDKIRKSGIIKSNLAKPIELFNDYDVNKNSEITAQSIYYDLKRTEIGRQTLKDIENLPQRIKLTNDKMYGDIRGMEFGGEITIYLSNCKNTLWASRTVIHEITHYKYRIGGNQWAEAVCVAQELKHARGRDYLTVSELRKIVKAVKSVYPEYNWKKGGTINGKRI